MSKINVPVTLRLMTELDLPMLHDWLGRPHIVDWWGGREARPTLDQVREHYLPGVLAKQAVTPYIALMGEEPIGFAQSYIALGSGDGWWEDETDPGVRGIDQSLANPGQLGKGLGTQLVRALVDLLFTDPAVTKIQTDPAPDNLRAIRCYCKAGFEPRKNIATPDGPAVYMVQTRQFYEQARGSMAQNKPQNKPQNNPLRALLAGATGLVGGELLKLLLADPRYASVHCIGRRAPAIQHPKLTFHRLNFADSKLAIQFAALPAIQDVYCALGTTIKVAGSQAAFKGVDLDAVVALAKAARQVNQAVRLGVVSAMAADAKSGVFYNRIKGEMEAAVTQLGFE